MIKKILNKIENNRNSTNFFWNTLVKFKDFLWNALVRSRDFLLKLLIKFGVIKKSFSSQLGADLFVLDRFKKGYFVEVGAFDGKELSNTYMLEKKGWKGICIDPFPKNFEKRKCILEEVACYSEKDISLDFVIGGELSGILQDVVLHRDYLLNNPDNKKVKIKTVLLSDILKKNRAPNFIEYLSLDTEGSEFEILKTFPFNEYQFGIITVEHNYEEPKRTLIRQLLEMDGYEIIKEVKFDDWYVLKNNLSKKEGLYKFCINPIKILGLYFNKHIKYTPPCVKDRN
jgi:FkbM family methyltransferase